MITLKKHILERLKVSSSETVTMTNRDFFNLLKEYTNVTNYVAFLPNKIWDDIDDMPKHSKDKTRYITSIQPYTGRHISFVLQLRDIYEGNIKGYGEVNVEQNGDDIVDFTDDDSLNKIIKYMQEAIKK